MVKRIVTENDLNIIELGSAYGVIFDYLAEALGRYGTCSFATYGSFYFLNETPSKNECLSMGFEDTLDCIAFEYTDEISLLSNNCERVLLNPTYIAEETDYVISLFVFEDALDKKTVQNIKQFTDVHTTKTEGSLKGIIPMQIP